MNNTTPRQVFNPVVNVALLAVVTAAIDFANANPELIAELKKAYLGAVPVEARGLLTRRES